jgi:hypothetical protein
LAFYWHCRSSSIHFPCHSQRLLPRSTSTHSHSHTHTHRKHQSHLHTQFLLSLLMNPQLLCLHWDIEGKPIGEQEEQEQKREQEVVGGNTERRVNQPECPLTPPCRYIHMSCPAKHIYHTTHTHTHTHTTNFLRPGMCV